MRRHGRDDSELFVFYTSKKQKQVADGDFTKLTKSACSHKGLNLISFQFAPFSVKFCHHKKSGEIAGPLICRTGYPFLHSSFGSYIFDASPGSEVS